MAVLDRERIGIYKRNEIFSRSAIQINRMRILTLKKPRVRKALPETRERIEFGQTKKLEGVKHLRLFKY